METEIVCGQTISRVRSTIVSFSSPKWDILGRVWMRSLLPCSTSSSNSVGAKSDMVETFKVGEEIVAIRLSVSASGEGSTLCETGNPGGLQDGAG